MDDTNNYYIKEQLHYVTSPKTRRGWRRLYDFALQHVRQNDTVLDCGCGLGQGTFLLSQRAKKAIGLDIDSQFIAYCKEHCTVCDFIRHDISHSMPFEDNHFDVVIAIEILEHLPTGSLVRKALTDMNRILKPGGFFVVSAPNRLFVEGKSAVRLFKHMILRIAGNFIKKQVRWHEQYFYWTPQTFRSLLMSHFETVSVFGQWSEGITQEAEQAPYLLARGRKAT